MNDSPPLISALLRVPWEAVQRRILERLHERGFDDLQQLGQERFAQLRGLLLELNQPA